MRSMLLVSAVVSLALAGCGSDGDRKSDDGNQAFADVERCLNDRAGPAGLDVSADLRSTDLKDVIMAQPDAQGALSISGKLTEQRILLVVERSSDDAKATEKLYQRFGIPKRYGNVVVSYSKPVTAGERSVVEDCVRSSAR